MQTFKCFCAGLATLTMLFSGHALADTDITAFLNGKLATKPYVQYHRDAAQPRRVCYWNGDVGPHSQICNTVVDAVRQNYAGAAFVTRSAVIKTRNPQFGQVSTLPETALIAKIDYSNCGPGLFSTSETLSVSGTRGWSVSKTIGISTTTSISLNAGFSIGVASTSVGISQSVTLSSSTTNTESFSTTDSRSTTSSISAQHGEAGQIEMIVYQSSADVPFQATVIVNGDLADNDSGKRKASDVLSEQERTLQFAGSVHLTGISNALVANKGPNVPFKCSDEASKTFASTVTYLQVPAGDLDVTYRSSFGTTRQLFEKKIPLKFTRHFTVDDNPKLKADFVDDGPSIGPPDGTHYTVISSSTVSKPTPACGFNDVSIPNNGNFSLEQRHYETWAGGQLVAIWDQTVETFQGCSGR